MRACGRQVADVFEIPEGYVATAASPHPSHSSAASSAVAGRWHRPAARGVGGNEIAIAVVWLAFYVLIFGVSVIAATT